MFFSHAAAASLYLVLPFAPSFLLAGAILVVRSLLAYMDNPLRESFTMAMVKSEERGSAAGVTNLARVVPFGVSPTLSAYLMQSLSLNVPVFVGGCLQLANDFTFYYLFRHVRPPEEIKVAEIKATSVEVVK
jgi:predicted MFS family arabinose efflux permease